jgi:hypothetical protein
MTFDAKDWARQSERDSAKPNLNGQPSAKPKPKPAGLHSGLQVKPGTTNAPPIPWQPFPVEALPEPVRGFVDAASRAIGCDASYVALPLLAALAAAIGNSCRIQLKRGWTEPAVIWAVIVGDSGTLKSPALNAPLQPIRKRQAEALRRHREALASYEVELQKYEADSKRNKGGNKQHFRPEQPVCERFWVSDVTVEALAARLSQAPRGLLVVHDELAGWIGSFGQYKGGKGADSAHWLTMHGARDLLVDRKTGDSTTVYVPNAAVSVTGGIQPSILRAALAQEHFQSGLAARLLLAMPPRVPKRWSEAEVDPDLEISLAKVFDALYAIPLTINPATNEPQPTTLKLSAEGKMAWVEFYNQHAKEQAELTGDLAAAWSKLEGYAARLALVIHLVRVAAGDPSLADNDAVDAQSVEAGATFSKWFGQEARRVYAVLNESDEQKVQRELVELIQRKGGKITVRDSMRSSRRFQNAQEAETALDALANKGLAVKLPIEPGHRGGKPTCIYRLVDTDNTLINAGEIEVLSTSAESSGDTNPEEEAEWTG